MEHHDWQFAREQAQHLQREFRTLPTRVGREIVSFARERFRHENYLDRTAQKWKPRAQADTQAKRRGRRNLLVQSGRLRRSIRVLRRTSDSVSVGSEVPYAAIHNYGGEVQHPGSPYIVVAGKAVWLKRETAKARKAAGKYVKTSKPHSIRIPQRQFLGDSHELRQRIVKVISKRVEHVLKRH